MSRQDVTAARYEALFASPLQRSESPQAQRVREEITRSLRELGWRGCAALMAQEFGDHPEAAAERMRWAREVVEATYLASASVNA